MVNKVKLIPVETSESPSQPDLFAADAFWKFLQPGTEPVEDPTVGTDYFSPTDKEDAKPKLFDYPDVFDRPPFINHVDVPVFDRFGRREKDEQSGKLKVKKEHRQEGTPTQSFLDQHHLDHNSRPIQFFMAFVPFLSQTGGKLTPITRPCLKILGSQESCTQILLHLQSRSCASTSACAYSTDCCRPLASK